ncbi:MAG: hypothetical protein R3183_01085 [Oleiphilaceae bacterium]|nr:hypothetical protein [Oleiphilaceae bacterium]
MNSKRIAQTSSLVLAVAMAAGCGSSSSTSPSSSASQAYNGPGSKWDVELFDDNTFTIERRATPLTPVDLTVEGTYERFDSGFVGLTVSSASGTDAPSQGDTAWALEVPGYAFLLKPTDGDQVIAMVTAGECPTSDIDANWVMVKQRSDADATNSSMDYFGTFNYDISSNTPSLPSKYAISTGFPAVVDGGDIGSGTCNDGLMLVGESPDVAAMYLTSTGGAIVQTNINNEADSQFVFALGQKTISDIGNLQGSYAGMLFDDSMPDGQNIQPVAMECDNTGTCTGTLVTDITTGAQSTDSVTVTLNGAVDSMANGFVTGSIMDDGANTGNLACMVDINANNSGKAIVNCVGQSPGDNTQMFNVMFVSI